MTARDARKDRIRQAIVFTSADVDPDQHARGVLELVESSERSGQAGMRAARHLRTTKGTRR